MIYADTTFLVAYRVPPERFYRPAQDFYETHQDEVWLWSPWHRLEVFNTVRQLTRHPDAKRRLLSAEAKAIIHHLENDVRVGYYTHAESDWREVLRTANEISVAHGFRLACRAADVLHVAYAKELAAQTFVSFDDDQLVLAQAAGLKTVKPQ
jgi:predicted nucleic acid-binding protein